MAAGSVVKLELKEACTSQDILLAGLTTESNGRLIKSGGMVYINATAVNRQLKVVKPIAISIPAQHYDDSMKLF